MFSSEDEDQNDWLIDSNGYYIATRSFLIRRGYCCANECRNCPYINWRNSSVWQPGPAEAVQFAEVSSKAIAGAKKHLAYHEEQLRQGEIADYKHHQTMMEHYRLLLERWSE